MVDIVSGASGARAVRRVAASFRLRSLSLPHEDRVEPAETASPQAGTRDDELVRVYLEVQDESGAMVYRLVDAASGARICEWRGEQIDELRKFLSENHIQLIDRKV